MLQLQMQFAPEVNAHSFTWPELPPFQQVTFSLQSVALGECLMQLSQYTATSRYNGHVDLANTVCIKVHIFESRVCALCYYCIPDC